MKICFLDIDGVLNSDAFFKNSEKEKSRGIHRRWPESQFDKSTIAILNNLKAKIVISSSWRRSRYDLAKVLKRLGLDLEVVGTTTLNRIFKTRGEEIRLFLIDNSEKLDITGYVILDDDKDMLPEQEKHLVKVNRRTGLTAKNIEKANRILLKKSFTY